jgi:TonB family protein
MDDMLADFANGDLDAVLNITPQSAQELVQNENVSIYSQPGNSYLYVGWNLEHPFLQDKLVRRALSMAINSQRILTDIYADMGAISLGPLPSSAWGYNETIEPIGYDADLALSALKEQGFADFNGNRIIDKDRKDFTIRIVTNSENVDRVTILRYIAEDLRRIGIRVIPQTLDAADFINALINKQFDGYIMGWRVGEKIDSNTVVDSLIDAGVSKLDRRKARETWHEFQRIIYEEQPYTFLVVPNDIAATYKRVKGVEHGVRLASASAYWIPEAERRVSVAAVIPETGPSTEGIMEMPTTLDTPEPAGGFVEESLAVITPERILEAAAQSDTTVPDTTTIVAAVPLAPPKPSVITRAEPNRRIEPEYPASAAEFGASGTIVVRVLVGTDGAVKDAEVIQSFGNPACEKAALDAARQWQFDPATKDGTPFEQRVSIPFTFARQ